jgi:hypothetical protein
MAAAQASKASRTTFLGPALNLPLAADQTLITHATTGRARFLGDEIGTMACQTQFDPLKRRVVQGRMGMDIPEDIMHAKRKRSLRDGTPSPRPARLNDSAYDILNRSQGEYRGLVLYDGLAPNFAQRG